MQDAMVREGMTRPDPISLRLPESLKTKLQQSANEAGRSVNAEIRMRLEWSYEGGFEGEPSDNMLAGEIETLRAELRASVKTMSEEIAKLKEKR